MVQRCRWWVYQDFSSVQTRRLEETKEESSLSSWDRGGGELRCGKADEGYFLGLFVDDFYSCGIGIDGLVINSSCQRIIFELYSSGISSSGFV